MRAGVKGFFRAYALYALSGAAYAAPPSVDDPVSDFSVPGLIEFIFSSERLLSVFGDNLQLIGLATLGFAFLCLVVPAIYGLVKEGLNAETVNRHVVRPLILCGLLATIATTRGIVETGFDELARVTGYEGVGLLRKYDAETKIFLYTRTPAEIRDDLSTDDRAALLTEFVALLTFLKDLFAWTSEKIVVVPLAVFFAVLTLSVAVGTFLAEFVRQVCLETGYALLPLFIAGLNTTYFRSASVSTAVRLLCVHTWTVSWGLVGAVTVGVVHMLHHYVDGLYAVIETAPAPTGGFFVLFPDLPLGVVVLVAGVMTVATLWHLGGLVAGAVLFSRMITMGGAVLDRWASHLTTQTFFSSSLRGEQTMAFFQSPGAPEAVTRLTSGRGPVPVLASLTLPARAERTLHIGASLPGASEKALARVRHHE